MNKTWYHIVSLAIHPFTAYGIATDEYGVVVSTTEKYNWMQGRNIEDIINYLANKPASICEVKVYE